LAAGGDTVPQLQIDVDAEDAEWVHLLGVTLGSDWAGFPAIAQRDFNSANERLDLNLPIYINWELNIPLGTCPDPSEVPNPTAVIPPRPLAAEPWFAGHFAEIALVSAPVAFTDNNDYNTCAVGDGVEEPTEINSYPVGADGGIYLLDVHGGTATEFLFALKYVQLSPGANPAHIYYLVFSWNRPQTYTDIVTDQSVNAIPGTTVRRPHLVSVNRHGSSGGPQTCGPYQMWRSVYIVEHVSADVSVASRRFVDAGDVAAYGMYQNQVVNWGFDNSGGPGARNFHVNFVPTGDSANFIDGSDLAKLAQELGTSCFLAKPGVEERAAILDWFGMVATGRNVPTGPNGETSPEYEFSDSARLARAMADPYGYRRNIAASVSKAQWGTVKALYR
jgi:hypothetical protein